MPQSTPEHLWHYVSYIKQAINGIGKGLSSPMLYFVTIKGNIMDKNEFMRLKVQFNDYKAEYSDKDTKEERRKELIPLMQVNLQERSGKDIGYIKCIDGKEHSLTSDNVEDLYDIDGTLNAEFSKKIMTDVADNARKDANENNQYGPANTYPKK